MKETTEPAKSITKELINIVRNKERYSKNEIIRKLEIIYGEYIKNILINMFKIFNLEKKNIKWENEHNRSLSIIIENNTQKLQLEQLNKELKEAYIKLEEISKVDFLTNLLNRKTSLEFLANEINRVSRIRENLDKLDQKAVVAKSDFNRVFGKLSCAFLDIDHFKEINDVYGHLIGDMVLKKIGEILSASKLLRTTDVSGRFGGEEFLIIMPDTNSIDALIPLGKILKRIRKTIFYSDENKEFHITVSIGVSEYEINDDSLNMVIDRADKALYYAKKHGRDKIVRYDPELMEKLEKKTSQVLNLYLTSKWSMLHKIRNAVNDMIQPIDKNLAGDTVMTASELSENAMKYGKHMAENKRMEFELKLEAKTIVITVRSGLIIKANYIKLKNTIDLINKSNSLQKLYTDRLHQLLKKKFQGESGIGLFRIAYEGRFVLTCSIVNNIITVIAKRGIDNL